MGKDRKSDQLHSLEEKIAKIKNVHEPKPIQEEHYSLANQAWRMVIELVAGLGIGFGIGYGLDSLFGTLPIFMVLFTFLGFAAGVKTMIRTAGELQTDRVAADAAKENKAAEAADKTKD
ncbi:AtpZ/AtpI family protein [Falsihalocynthiibacter sp. SS001]|uniref:AtpZ/AtpI family protein n=1 Tax=Falsihalocynthiibacter sp. SS001 TaxID=3349698 RepID=UPI0036D2B06E